MVATRSAPAVSFIDGTAEKVNHNGFTLAGREGWLNLSNYASPAPHLPHVGRRVRVGLDKAGFVRSIETMEPETATAQPSEDGPTARASEPVDRDRRIVRQAVLNTATAVLGSSGPVDVAELLQLAARLEAWVTR